MAKTYSFRSDESEMSSSRQAPMIMSDGAGRVRKKPDVLSIFSSPGLVDCVSCEGWMIVERLTAFDEVSEQLGESVCEGLIVVCGP